MVQLLLQVLNFVTSATTGLFHKNPDEFGISIAGVEKAVYGTSFNIANDFQVGDTTTTASPVLKVDVANSTIITGTAQKGLRLITTHLYQRLVLMLT